MSSLKFFSFFNLLTYSSASSIVGASNNL